MGIEGVIFDVSGTLLDNAARAVPDVIPAIARLRKQSVQIIAASNEPKLKAMIQRELSTAGVVVDYLVTKSDVGVNKGSPAWIDRICSDTGLQRNQLMYVGDSDPDMRTA